MFRRRSVIGQPKFGLVRGAEPVRAIRPRIRRASVPGIFPTVKGVQPFVRTESLGEMDALELFEVDPEIVLMAGQPHQLRYFEPLPDGTLVKRSYVPDVALLKDDGTVVVVDFKPESIAQGAKWQRKSQLIGDAYRLDHRVTFLTITDAMVRIEPRRQNVKLLILHRELREDDDAKMAVLAHIDRVGLPMALGDVRTACRLPHSRPDVDRAKSALLNLVIDGVVAMDMSTPITDASLVYWPSRKSVAEVAA